MNKGADIERVDKHGRSPLRYAAHQNYLEATATLLRLGANVHHANQYGSAPLHYAAMRGNDAIVSLLVTSGGADVSRVDSHSRSPLHLAAIEGRASTCKVLVGLGASVSEFNKYGSTPLHYAAMMGHVGTSQVLHKLGAEPRARNKIGNLPLHLCADKGHLDMVDYLIKLAPDCINCENNFGVAPIHQAAQAGRDTTVSLLIRAGAHMNKTRKHGLTPVSCPCFASLTSFSHCPHALTDQKNSSRSQMHLAAQGGHKNVVHTLIHLGAIVNCTTQESASPLVIASAEGHAGIVELLEGVVAAQDMARAGNFGAIKASIAAGTFTSPCCQYIPLLSAEVLFELAAWARAAAADASGCYAALYLPVDFTAVWPSDMILRSAVHDGVRHIQRSIASFLVHPCRRARACIREISTFIRKETHQGDAASEIDSALFTTATDLDAVGRMEVSLGKVRAAIAQAQSVASHLNQGVPMASAMGNLAEPMTPPIPTDSGPGL